jgi:ABC-type lipopolysaccharide export system ATPase subunit
MGLPRSGRGNEGTCFYWPDESRVLTPTLVKRLDMEPFRHKKALLTEPKILFLDEPTASLDPDIAYTIRAVLKEERRSSGLSILYTSHNIAKWKRGPIASYCCRAADLWRTGRPGRL